jgi:hypothetical protein
MSEPDCLQGRASLGGADSVDRRRDHLGGDALRLQNQVSSTPMVTLVLEEGIGVARPPQALEGHNDELASPALHGNLIL